MKKLQFFGFLAIMLTFGLIFLGCSRSGGTSTAAAQTSGPGQASPAPAAVSEAPESDFAVTISSDNAGARITAYTGTARIVVIPATIQGLPVREIGHEAFRVFTVSPDSETSSRNEIRRNITSVVIPEGVVRIGDGAFGGCRSLNSVTLPGSLKVIGREAFSGCIALTSITLPVGLTELGIYVFGGAGFTSFPDPWPTAITTITGYSFARAKISGNLVIPEGITVIEKDAFRETNITSVTLPSTIREIEDSAFESIPSLTTVNIPESVGSIEFHGSSFVRSRNINLASQARLRALGYRGSF